MNHHLEIWRLLKFIAVGLWTAGLAGALFSRSQPRRLWSAHVVATAGLFATWATGYGMMKLTGARFSNPWIGVSLIASLLTLHEACAIAERPKVLPWNVGALVATWLASLSSMVFREPDSARQVAVFAAPALVGIAAFVAQLRLPNAHSYAPGSVRSATRKWVVWMARLEGASLIALLGVYMPLKYGAGIVLDGGQGWFGWVHGMLSLVWLQALWSGWRRLGWSWRLTALGFVASLLPLGTFILERYMPAVEDDT